MLKEIVTKKCMVRPVRARFLDLTTQTVAQIISLSRVDCCCSQAMMRSARVVLK